MRKPMKRHRAKKTTIVPVIIGTCHYKPSPFYKFDPEPKKHGCVKGNRDRRDDAWTEVAEKLHAIATRKKRP